MKWIIEDKRHFSPYLQSVQNKYKEIGIGNVMAKILLDRGFRYEDIRNLITNPAVCLDSPDVLYGCSKVSDAIISAVYKHKKIIVFADYDVDGLTAGYVMYTYLKGLGTDVSVYYPERHEGYGLSLSFLQKLNGDEVIITVDNGIGALPAIRYCKDNGITLIITDHHQPKEDIKDVPVCDPWCDPDGKGHHLCGAAVAWKVCMNIDDLLGREEAWKLTPYVAIGTIADVMPMTLENMAIVRTGLQMIGQGFAPNIQRFFMAEGISQPTTVDIAWKLAPKLNAAGRMGRVDTASDFLFYEGDSKGLNKHIMNIDSVNKERKVLSKQAEVAAAAQNYDFDAFCLFDATEYPVGISGLIANKLVEIFDKPAIVYTRTNSTTWPASMRSNGFNMLPYLERLKQQSIIYDYGGHRQACGISLFPDIETFQTKLNGYIRIPLSEFKQEEQAIYVDAEISLSDVNNKLMSDITAIPSDSVLFPEPIFIVRGLTVVDIEHSRNNPDNIKLHLVDKDKSLYKLWAWNKDKIYKAIGNPKHIDIIGKVTRGFGNEVNNAVFNVEDLRCAI